MTTSTLTASPKQVLPLPPGPKGNLFFGSGPESQANPLEFYWKAFREYGPVVQFHGLPGMQWYLYAHPEAIERALQSHHTAYGKPGFVVNSIDLLVGSGILTSDGATWRKNRRTMQPAFHRQKLAGLGQVMVDRCDAMLKTWESHPANQPLDIGREMFRLTLQIAGVTLFGAELGAESERMGQAFSTAFAYVSDRMRNPFSLPLWLPLPRNQAFKAEKQYLDSVVRGMIQRRRQSGKTDETDLLGLLMAARDEETGEGLSDEALMGESMTLLVAGHDTVGATLSWAWALLGKHPDVMAKLQQEADSVLGGRLPTVEDLPSLPYTRMVFEETLRLYPPAWTLPRLTLEEDEVMGFRIPAGSMIVIGTYIAQRDPAFWENPDAFIPERFSPEAENHRPRYAYHPFGGGPRQCIGNQFAMMEGPLLLAAIAQRFSLRLVPGQNIQPDATFTLKPKNGVKCILKKRGQ